MHSVVNDLSAIGFRWDVNVKVRFRKVEGKRKKKKLRSGQQPGPKSSSGNDYDMRNELVSYYFCNKLPET